MAELHKAWIMAAEAAGLVRFESANVKINDVPNKGDEHLEPFQRAIFVLSDEASASKLYGIAEAGKGTVKDEDGNESPAENPLATLLTYAYGLNCRAKVRTTYEAKFEDPDKAIKQIAEKLVKSGRFKSYDKALAAARLLQEE